MTPPPAATIPATARARAAAARPTTPHRAWSGLRRPGGTLRSLPRPVIARPTVRGMRDAVIDRLVGGRAWIGVLGVMLLGLVFLQVSLLQLNTRISTDIGHAAKLERSNAEVSSAISHLNAGRRVQDAARNLGMILPGAGALCYLSAARTHPCDGGGQSGSTAQAADTSVVTATPPPGSAAALTGPAQATPVTTAAGTATTAAQQPRVPQTPAVTQPAPAAQTPAAQAPAATQLPATTPPVATQTPPPATVQTLGGQAAPQG